MDRADASVGLHHHHDGAGSHGAKRPTHAAKTGAKLHLPDHANARRFSPRGASRTGGRLLRWVRSRPPRLPQRPARAPAGPDRGCAVRKPHRYGAAVMILAGAALTLVAAYGLGTLALRKHP